MKAVLITKGNKKSLEVQFEMDEGDLDLSSGLYLVSGFGDHMIEGLLTKANLTLRYFVTGKKLNNGWFEVVSKANYAAGPIFSDAP